MPRSPFMMMALLAAASAALATTACSSSKKSAPAAESGSAAATAASGAAGAPGDAGGAAKLMRREIDCPDVISGTQSAAQTTLGPGWGKLASDLQVLPAGGELCGSGEVNGHVSAFVRSQLFGQELADLYAPVIKQLGCTAKVTVNSNGTVEISLVSVVCGERRFSLVTDSTYAFYSVQQISG